MKRWMSSLFVLLGAGAALLWFVPAARGVLDVYPPARAAFEAMAPPPSVSPAGQPAASKAPNVKAPNANTKGRGGGTVPVTVATTLLTDMPIILTAPGTVEAEATVAVKTRVDGQIVEVLFKEGDLVAKDQVLFKLDDRLILSQIKQAEATIRRDQANLAEALATLERRNALIQKRIVTEAAMDTAKTTVETLKASIAAGQAALEAQRTLLDYLVIRAPITGRTGSAQAKPGNNVRAADTAPLVVINQIQPIAVSFSLPQADILALRRALAERATGEITIPGPVPLVRTGRIDFIDNQVDRQTGTLVAKLQAPNADEVLWPGQAVEVALKVEVRKGMLTVPASAVLPSQNGMIVWVVGEDKRVTPRPVTLDRVIGQTAYLAGGLKAGEIVVTDGQVRLATGAAIVVRDPNAPRPAPGAQPGAKNEKKGNRATDRRS